MTRDDVIDGTPSGATMTALELTAILKARLKEAIERDKPQTELEFRLTAIRLAEALASISKQPELKDTLYDAFMEMMGLTSWTAKR